jgi:hypothetical protein
MRVCLDLSVLRSRPTGVGYYGYFLGKALVENFVEAENYLVFDGLRFLGLKRFVDAHTRQSEIKAGLYQSLWNATAPYPALRSAWRLVKGSAFSRGAARCDLVHAISYAPPIRAAAAWLPLVHDLSHLRFPQFHPAERVRWLKAHDAALDDAILINTVSEFTKGDIVVLLGVDPDRVRVTYPGVNPAFGQARSDDASVLSRYGLKAGRFLLSVATLDPRKNLTTIAAAFARLPQSLRRDAPSSLSGSRDGIGSHFRRTSRACESTARYASSAMRRLMIYEYSTKILRCFSFHRNTKASAFPLRKRTWPARPSRSPKDAAPAKPAPASPWKLPPKTWTDGRRRCAKHSKVRVGETPRRVRRVPPLPKPLRGSAMRS